MAERIEIELVDDIDGTAAVHTLRFALDGVVYDIDLNRGHAQQLRATLEFYIHRARPAKKSDSGTTPTAGNTRRQREQRRRRQAHRDVTAQIRQAAQRSREHAQARQGSDTTVAEQDTMKDQPATPVSSVQPRPEPAPVWDERKQPERPAVPLPQFSSAT